ncbi:PAS domain-containing protein [Phaeobacter sp. JH20_36]
MELLGTLLRHSTLPLSLINPEAEELELVFVNRAFEQATGYRAQDVIDRPCPLFQGPAVQESSVSLLKHARDMCRRGSQTLWNYNAEGEPFECLTYIDPITVSPGNVVLLGCHFPLSPQLSSSPPPTANREDAGAPQAEAERAGDGGSNRAEEVIGLQDQKDELLDYARKALMRCLEMRRNTLYSRIDLYFNRRRGNLLGAEPQDVDAAAMARDPLLGPRASQV